MALHVMSLSSGASALMLFTWLGPVVLVVALAVIRSAFGPRLALRRLRRGRPARIRMWLSGPPGPEETVLRARLLRVDDDAHIIGAGFHWVVPASGLEVLDPAEPISVVHPGGGTDDLSIDPRWRAAFTLAVADDGPRWSAASRKSRWVGAPWWILPNAAIMAALAVAAAACLAASTRHWTTFIATAPASACFVSFADGGVDYQGWVTCWGPLPDPPADLIFNTLAWPFAGESYSQLASVAMVAVPALLALFFATSHVHGARKVRLERGERLHVQEEQSPRPQTEDLAGLDAADRQPEVDDPWDIDQWHAVEKAVMFLVALGAPILAIVWIYDHVDFTWAEWLSIPIVTVGDLASGMAFVFAYGALRARWRRRAGRAQTYQRPGDRFLLWWAALAAASVALTIVCNLAEAEAALTSLNLLLGDGIYPATDAPTPFAAQGAVWRVLEIGSILAVVPFVAWFQAVKNSDRVELKPSGSSEIGLHELWRAARRGRAHRRGMDAPSRRAVLASVWWVCLVIWILSAWNWGSSFETSDDFAGLAHQLGAYAWWCCTGAALGLVSIAFIVRITALTRSVRPMSMPVATQDSLTPGRDVGAHTARLTIPFRRDSAPNTGRTREP